MSLISKISQLFQNHPNLVLLWDVISEKIVYQNRFIGTDLGFSEDQNSKSTDLFFITQLVIDSDKKEFENLFYPKEGDNSYKAYITFQNIYKREELFQVSVYNLDLST